MLLNRALKSRLHVAPLAAACDLLFPTLTLSREKHSEPSNESPGQVVTSRTKRDNRIRFFVINNRPNEALDLLERSLFRTPIIDPQTNKARYLKLPPASVCNKVLDSASHVKDPDLVIRAADLAGALQLEGVGIEARTAQSLMHGLAHVGMVDKGIDLLDGWMNANIEILEDDEAAQDGPAHVMATLLEAAAQADDTDAITQVLLRMARVGLSPAPHSMTTLLQCFSRLGNVTTAHSMLQWMRRSGIEPQAVHYAALMTMPAMTMQYSQAQNFLLKAKEAYRDMQSHDVQPSAYFYAAFINVCSRFKDLEAARDAWLDMERSENVQPDLVCYTTMIDACAKGGDVEGAFHLYEEMQKNGIKPDAVVFATLLSAVSLGSTELGATAVEQANEIWDTMKKAGITPVARTISVYLNILLRAGEHQNALELLRQESKGAASLALYEQGISYAAEQDDIELLKLLVNQMKELNAPFTPHDIKSLLQARARKIEKEGGSAGSAGTAAVPWHTWHFGLDVDSRRGKYTAVQLGSTYILDKLIESLEHGSNDEHAKRLLDQATQQATSGTLTADEAFLLIGWHSVEGSVEQALDIYTTYADSIERFLRILALKMLLAGAMAIEDQQQQVALVLKVVGEARTFAKLPSSSGWWWDQKTQRIIASALKNAPEATGVVHDGQEPLEDVRLHPRTIRRRP